MDAAPLTVTIEEAARMLGIGRGTAYEQARQGTIPTLRFGKRVVVPLARLRAMLGLPDNALPAGAAAASHGEQSHATGA